MPKHVPFLILAVCAAAACAQTPINGNAGGMTLDSSGSPFVVEKELTVPRGKTLTVKEGCVLLFKQFAGLTIKGNCFVNGTPAHPVVFTSINDSVYNKTSTQESNPFDWNGITVTGESSDVLFKYVNVRYSTFGIKSQNPDMMILQGLFAQNGQFHFTVNDKIQTIAENQPFSYNENRKIPEQPAPAAKAPLSRQRKILRFGLLGAGAAGAITGIILSANAASKYSHWKDISSQTNPLPPPGEYEKRRDAFHGALTGAIITDIIGVLGLAGFGLTFVF